MIEQEQMMFARLSVILTEEHEDDTGMGDVDVLGTNGQFAPTKRNTY